MRRDSHIHTRATHALPRTRMTSHECVATTTTTTGSTPFTPQDATPFNIHNRLLTLDLLVPLLSAYDPEYRVHDINIYRRALTHKSYCTRKNENFLEGNTRCPEDCIPLQEESNERLEFLGDAVINLIVGSYLFERFPDDNEGFLTKMRTKLVNGNMLAWMCKMTGLPKYVIISRQIEDNCGRQNKRVLEDCFEAFIGAMFIDAGTSGYVACERWFVAFMERHVDFADLVMQHNSYKDSLSKYFQHTFHCMPRFCEVDTGGGGAGGGVQSVQTQGDPVCDSVGDANDPASGSLLSYHPGDGAGSLAPLSSSSSSSSPPERTYTVCIRDRDNVVISAATAATKKQAENDAARSALLYYGVHLSA